MTPSRLRPRTLNQALGWLLAAVIAPLLLGTLGLLALQAAQDKRVSQLRLGALAQTLLQATDAELERTRAQLEVLAASPDIDEGNWRHLREFALQITAKVPGSLIVLVGGDGQVLLNTFVAPGQPLPNLWQLGAQSTDASWEGRALPLSSGNLSRQAYESGQPVFSDLYFGVQVLRPALSVAVPVQRNGRSFYALIFSFPPSLLQDRLQAALTVPDIRAVLVDRRGLVVATNDAAVSRLADRLGPIDNRAATGFYRTTSRDGLDMVGAYAVSRLTGYTVRVAQPQDGYLLSSRLTSIAFVVLLLTAMLASGILAGVLSRRLAKPLRELGDDVVAGRAPPPERDTGLAEIDLLANALRHGALAEHQRAEEQTRRRLAETQEAMLRQADRQKDEFLATLAHELRNPLAPIRTSVELIRLRGLQDPVLERARATIERQTMHLSHLVDDLLDVSRITLGRIQLRQEAVNLAEVASSAADSVTAAASRAGLAVERAFDGPVPWVRGDGTRLTQCVVNLLNNAVKFTARQGVLTVSAHREGTLAVVEVRDSGVGIAAENIDRIFELFVQERHSGHGGNTGLGIGLALTRRLVELHGGAIRAYSEGLGRGSRFRIELPAIDAPEPAQPQAPVAQREGGHGARILVVDDNRDAAETLGELLGMSGYEVTLAHDGESAVRAVLDHPPDAALLDIGLPDIDGYEACRRIRARSGEHRPLLVAVTGWGQESDQRTAREAGFDAHLTKPVAPDSLMALLSERLRK